VKYLKNYLVIIGVFAHIALLILLIGLFSHYELTPRQFLVRAMEKAEVDIPVVKSLLEPAFPEYVPVTGFIDNEPRILPQVKKILNGELTPDNFKKNSLNIYNPCSSTALLGNLSCWLYKNDESSKKNLLRNIEQFSITLPTNDGKYGTGWELALAYDSIRTTELLKPHQKEVIEKKLLNAVSHYLLLLNGDSASQWHGRATLAAQMWLCFIALDNPPSTLLPKVESHFEQLVQALELTPAWPEGYNYWINNRALHISLALGSYLNGTNDSLLKRRVAVALENIGYWHIYATRPDATIEPIGDKGLRLDLKDETRRVIDLLAQVTNNRDFAYFSAYLESLHKQESYYRGYRWGYFLFNNPDLAPSEDVNSLTGFNYFIPYSRIFGEEHYGLAFFRQNWSESATFMNYKAGDTFTHHGHYDAGHFSLFKGAPLIVNSSEYGDYLGENRLGYAIRTIAKNSLIIQKPLEKVKPNRFFEKNIADGGQRVLIPTGSAIQSVDQWYRKRSSGKVFAGGEIKTFESNDEFTFINSDLTKAYNSAWHDENGDGGKVQLVHRSLLYLRDEDTLFVYDEVKPTDPSYRVKSLLHMVNMPLVKDAVLVKGKEHNGIYQSNQNTFTLKNGIGRLVGTVFHNGYLQLIGGYDYKFYVETDGDDSKLNGQNLDGGLSEKKHNQASDWRLEIVSGIADEHRTLTILQPSLHVYKTDKPMSKKIEGGVAVKLKDKLIVLTNGKELIRINGLNKDEKVLILGLKSNLTYQLTTQAGTKSISSTVSLEFKPLSNIDYVKLRITDK